MVTDLWAMIAVSTHHEADLAGVEGWQPFAISPGSGQLLLRREVHVLSCRLCGLLVRRCTDKCCRFDCLAVPPHGEVLEAYKGPASWAFRCVDTAACEARTRRAP